MRYFSFLLPYTLIAVLCCAASTPSTGQANPVEQAQKWAKEAKDQQAKAEAAAKKIDCEKPKSADKKALVDAVKKAQEAAKNAQQWADDAHKSAKSADDAADKNPKDKNAQKAKEKADQAAKDAQTAADEANQAAKTALDQAPGMAAADAIGKELDKKDASGNSAKKKAVDRLKNAANSAAEANPCDPEAVKSAVRAELEKIKKDVSGNHEVKPWVDSLGDDLKNGDLIFMPASGNDALVLTAQGTGRTTGHIADLSIFNPTDQVHTLDLGACFIPSGGGYQPYIVPSVPPVTVAPHASANIPITGYCANIFSAPVPAGATLPPLSDWVFNPALATSWQPLSANGWQPVSAATGSIPTIPGTAQPLGHVIDPNRYPEESAPVLFEALIRISQAYDAMHETGAITTPFSGNPEKERESVIQQTFWIYAAELSGQAYKREQFEHNTIAQFESATGQPFTKAPETQQKQLEQGVQDFWSTFQAVGVEAKVLKTQPR